MLNDSDQTSAPLLVVFDLDDTLADTSHRRHILDADHPSESAKWDAFFDACDGDVPKFEILSIYNALWLSGHYRLEIWTGRSEKVRAKTEAWLSMFVVGNADTVSEELQPPIVRMRAADDIRHDTEVKADFLKEAGQHPFFVFDDRNSVVKWWRDQGVTCLQVKESDF